MNTSNLWISPKHELSIDKRLIEAGEIFPLFRKVGNEYLMGDIKQIVAVDSIPRSRWDRKRCDRCGKIFIQRRFWTLHQLNGCGRNLSELFYYAEMKEDMEDNDNQYRMYLLTSDSIGELRW